MRSLLILSFIVFVTACHQTERITDGAAPTTDATGKGNGGNGLQISKKEMREEFSGLKPAVRQALEGLKAQLAAEKLSPGITDLESHRDVMRALEIMFKGNSERVTVMDDLASEFHLVNAPCVDQLNQKNAAGALLLKPNSPICFSLPILRSESPVGGDAATEVLLISLAVHEFVHHFIDLGTHDRDERIAVSVQSYVSEQLQKAQVVDDGVVLIDAPYSFVERFMALSKQLLEIAKQKVPPPPPFGARK